MSVREHVRGISGFDLYVRGSTRLSGPLQQAVQGGFVNLWARLPG